MLTIAYYASVVLNERLDDVFIFRWNLYRHLQKSRQFKNHSI